MGSMIPGGALTSVVVKALNCPVGYVRQMVGGQLVCVPAPAGLDLSSLFAQYKAPILIGGAVLAVLLLSKRK